jgi:hypothetical protein
MSVSNSSFLQSGLNDTETSNLSSSLTDLGNNKIFNSVIVIILVLYVTLAAPKLPKSIASIFDWTIVKLLYIFLIGYLASRNPAVSLIVAIVLLVTIQTLTAIEQGKQIFSLPIFCQDTPAKQLKNKVRDSTQSSYHKTKPDVTQIDNKFDNRMKEKDYVFIINDDKLEDKNTQELYIKMDKIADQINKKTINEMLKDITESFIDIEIKGITMSNTVNSTTDVSADMSSGTLLQISGDSLRISKDYAKKYKNLQKHKGVEGFDNISKQLLINTINNHIKAIAHVRVYILNKNYSVEPSNELRNKINSEQNKINIINEIEEYIEKATRALDKDDSEKLHIYLVKAQDNNKKIQEIIKKEILTETSTVIQESQSGNLVLGETSGNITYTSVPKVNSVVSPIAQQTVNSIVPMAQQTVNYMELPTTQQTVNYMDSPTTQQTVNYMELPTTQQKVNYMDSPVVQQEKHVYMESPVVQQEKHVYMESPIVHTPVPLGMLNKQSESFANVMPNISIRSVNSEMNTLSQLPNDISYCKKQNDNPSKDYMRTPVQCSIDNTCNLSDNTSINPYMVNNVEYGMV